MAQTGVRFQFVDDYYGQPSNVEEKEEAITHPCQTCKTRPSRNVMVDTSTQTLDSRDAAPRESTQPQVLVEEQATNSKPPKSAVINDWTDTARSTSLSQLDPPSSRNYTALQQHILFWDQDADGVIYPHHVYLGFRALGFSIPFSIGSLLIPWFFSYPTTLGHSFIPDPFFRIYIDTASKAKHGSDTGIYDSDGKFRSALFDELFDKFDSQGDGSLGVADLFWLLKRNRAGYDPAGWAFAFMEWWTTWLLLARDGRVYKDDLRACYDGSLFWRIEKEVKEGRKDYGYGWGDFFWGVLKHGTWKTWEVDKKVQGDRYMKPDMSE